MAHTKPTRLEDSIVADHHPALEGAITGARDGDRLVLNGVLPVMVVDGSRPDTIAVTETETGHEFWITTDPLTRTVTTAQRQNNFEVSSIAHPHGDLETSAIYAHRADADRLFCSFDVEYHRLGVWVERVEATAFNRVTDEVLEQLPTESERIDAGMDPLKVGTVAFSRFRIDDITITNGGET